MILSVSECCSERVEKHYKILLTSRLPFVGDDASDKVGSSSVQVVNQFQQGLLQAYQISSLSAVIQRNRRFQSHFFSIQFFLFRIDWSPTLCVAEIVIKEPPPFFFFPPLPPPPSSGNIK